MDRYSANGLIAAVTGAPGDTALGIIASALTRAKIHFFALSEGGTPADYIIRWEVRRFTAIGTSTPVVPLAIDPGAPVAQLQAGQGYTVEPTYVQTLLDLQAHMRSLYQWNAAPGGELVLPAVANNGIGWTPSHGAYVGPSQVSCQWLE